MRELVFIRDRKNPNNNIKLENVFIGKTEQGVKTTGGVITPRRLRFLAESGNNSQVRFWDIKKDKQ